MKHLQNRVYWSVYHVVLAMLFVTLCPCLLLFALTLRISLALRNAIAKRLIIPIQKINTINFRKSLCAPNSEIDARNKKCTTSRYVSGNGQKAPLFYSRYCFCPIVLR